ncbi:MAG: zinc ribbon domain-containing protein [Chloroflexi bacterium]|nr:zinc ribbon domain-containing protein [Chloroflexota bacterium]
MPVYTYRCEACGLVFDQHLSFHDPHPTRCPECGEEALRRVYKPVGIVFKGSGFYATDHRSPSGGNGHKAASSASSTAEAGDGGTSKTETAAKSETKASTSEAKATSSKKD